MNFLDVGLYILCVAVLFIHDLMQIKLKEKKRLSCGHVFCSGLGSLSGSSDQDGG
jgi:hypothetical protein